MIHVNNLPLASAFVAETRGGYKFIGWDQDRYMTASLIDAVRVLQHILILVNVDPKKKKPDAPEPYPLPDDIEKKQVEDPGSFTSMLLKAKAAKARRLKEEGDGCLSIADSLTASVPEKSAEKACATPTTDSKHGAESSEPSGRRGAPQRWKQNSR
jgi:hypothetical protein